MEDMSAGQASTLLRNEQQCDRAREQLEELEDTLLDSIRDSIRAKTGVGRRDKRAAVSRKRDSDNEGRWRVWALPFVIWSSYAHFTSIAVSSSF